MRTIADVVTVPHDLSGVLLEGRYRVGELLAVGGMSRVYRGTDTRLDRAVAVKVMDSRLAADPAFRGRLEREARAMARIEHPSVVDVHDQGQHGAGPEPLVYLVMELVEGATLRELIVERGSLDVAEALAVLEPVLGALAAAHREGLAHRDVKPENVLISRTGTIKVADFGLVTAAATSRDTTAGMIMGTPAYLSPEQVVGEGVGPRTDVYATGVLLFELLTGAPPFGGDNPLSVAYRHVNSNVPPPSTLVPGLPPELDALVVRATRRAAEDRPADAETMLFAVRGVRAALGIPAVPVPVPAGAHGSGTGGRTPLPGTTTTGGYASPGTIGIRPTAVVPPGAAPPPRATRALSLSGYPAGDGPAHARPDERHAAPPSRRPWPALGVGAVVLLGVLAGVLGWNWGGGSGVSTPSVVGLAEPDAQRALTESGLYGVVTERHDDTVPTGVVAASDPVAGTDVRSGSRVTLTVSTGRPRVPPIPVGSPVAAAEGLLRQAELTSRLDEAARRFHPTAPAGSVIDTVPRAGSQLAIGTPVTLVLSRGPALERDQDSDNGLGGSISELIQRELERALGGGN